jgi:hypothetical protein
MMTIEQMRGHLSYVACMDYTFEIVEHQTGFIYLQGFYAEPDVNFPQSVPRLQSTRKWYLSPHITKGELVQTVLKLVLTSVEHRVREHFLYRGKRIFGPHFDIDKLAEIADQTEVRS